MWSDSYFYDKLGLDEYINGNQHQIYQKSAGRIDESYNPIVSENYNDTLEYVPRGARKEYSKVGLLGQLVVQDDGTCKVNGYCTASVNGVATKSDSGYRVIKRIDKKHIKIILK